MSILLSSKLDIIRKFLLEYYTNIFYPRFLIYIRNFLFEHYPSIFYPLFSLKHPNLRDNLVQRDTEIVIEGFPRSANTFSVLAFLDAQKRPAKIAYHLHIAAQIIRAAQLGIPAIVLIRPPKDAVASWVVFSPHISIFQALKDYTGFYKSVWPYRENYILAEFEEVTSDFSKVIYQLNQKFGTNFELPNIQLKEDAEKVFKEGLTKIKFKEGVINSSFEGNLEKKSSIVQEIESQKYIKYLKEAESIYNQFTKSNDL